MIRSRWILLLTVFCVCSTRVVAGDENSSRSTSNLEFRDGDRVVLIGGTFIERMQAYNYFETLVTATLHDRHITFRNLGWSGDNVWGDARAVFGKREDGFKRLFKDVADVKPTVIVVAYGANEAFAGKAGLDDFRGGLKRLLSELKKATDARFIIMTPLRHEDLGGHLPDPFTFNNSVAQYDEVLRDVAPQFDAPIVDLSKFVDSKVTSTTNGIHLSEFGYWRLSRELSDEIRSWSIGMDVTKKESRIHGVKLDQVSFSADHVKFHSLDEVPGKLRNPHGSAHGDAIGRLRVVELTKGNYELTIDDQSVATGSDADWKKGVDLIKTPQHDQAEALRAAIAQKNELYFHRYRPQNETYLFLFRKHEQGNNAVEIPQFDALVAEKEKLIAELRKPVRRTYELRRNR